jgi:membrane protease YdiL (CAAX protease family)
MHKILVIFIATASGILYFILGQAYLLLAGLLLVTIFTRFNLKTKNLGKFVEILFLFYLISLAIYSVGIAYPYSLIIVLAFLVLLIFYEGPQWSELYFGFGNTKAYFKIALGVAGVSLLFFTVWIYLTYSGLHNPVPLFWPLDTLVIAGIGFAFYLAIVEEMIFRSFIFERAKSAVGAPVAIPVQGLLYGLTQFAVGIPQGIPGVILAALFGTGLGFLVEKTNSIYLAMLVRFIVTLGIFLQLTILGKLSAH